MFKHRSIYTRAFFLLLTQALVALLAVVIVSAASDAPAQLPPFAATEAGGSLPVPDTFSATENTPLPPRQPTADTNLEISIVSSPWAMLDSNKPETEGPRVLVVEAVITNAGTTTATLPVLTLDYNEDPANDWVLLPGEDPERKATELAPGDAYHAYWFATYTTTRPIGHVYTVTASANNASPVSTSLNAYRPMSDTVQTVRALSGGSTRLQETTSDIIVGVVFTATVKWDLGSNFQGALLSPVGNLDFDPSSYRLVATKVTFTDELDPLNPIITDIVDDRLYFDTLPALTTHAQGDFIFLALRPTETRICPYTTPKYQDYKYDNEYCLPGLPVTGTVTLSMAKQVNASAVQQGQMLTYTIAYTNNGTKPLGNVWIWDDVDPAIGSIITPTIDPPGDPGETTEQRAAWNVGRVAPAGKAGSTGLFTFTIVVDGGGQDLANQTSIVNHAFFGIDPVELPANAALTSTATSTVQAPTVTVAKTDGLDLVRTGEALTYTLRITNSGSVTATNVVVTDLLPGGVSPGGGSSQTFYPPPIPPYGGFAVLEIPVTVDALVPDGSTLTNVMTTAYQNEAGWTYDPKTATDETTVSAPFWVLTKVDDPGVVVAGTTLTYTLTYYHNGITPAQDVTITDTLPAEVTYQGVVSQPPGWDPPVYDSGPPASLTWYTPTLTVGATGTMVFTVTVNSDASGLITNQATLTSTDPATYTMTTEDTTVSTSADLAVTKTDDPATVIAGEKLTYTLQVSNIGPSDASGVTLTDSLPSGVSLISATPERGSFDDINRVWSLGVLTDSHSAFLTLLVSVDSNLTSTLTNTAIVSGDQDDPVSVNNTVTETTLVNTSADLAVTKSDDPATVIAGEKLTYTLQVSNIGPSDASGVTLTDSLPSGVSLISATPERGSFDDVNRVWSLGVLTDSHSASLTLLVSVDSSVTTTLTNTAIVSGDQDDPVSANNTVTETTLVNTSADLVVTKSDDPATVIAGENLTYTLQVSNSGPSDASGVTLTDSLPSGVSLISATPERGSFDDVNRVWSLGVLTDSHSASLTLLVSVDSSVTTTLTNTAIVSGDQDDPVSANNTVTETTLVNTSADLAVTKSDDPATVIAGEKLTYTLQVSNIGPSDASGVTLTDSLPSGVSLLSATPERGSFDDANRVWSLGVLTDSHSASLTLLVSVDSNLTTTLTNTAIVSGDQDDPVSVNNTVTETTLVNTSADLAVTKSDDPATVIAGNNLTYTLQVSNIGPSDASGVTLTDSLPSGVYLLSATPERGSFDDLSMVWSLGVLTDSHSASLTLLVSVDSAVTTTLTNTAIVSGDQDDPVSVNNTVTETTLVSTSADLAIAKSDDPDPVAAAGTLTYTLTYTNSGPSDAQDVHITDTLDSNTEFGGVVSQPPEWTALPPDPGAPNTRFWHAATISGDTSDLIVFTVKVNANTIGAVVNNVTITSETPDDDTSNNSAQERTVVGDPSLATIYGYVFDDSNCNGIWDDDEAAIEEVLINLYGPTSEYTRTNAVGSYDFITDQTGVYRVVETDRDGYFSTTPNEVHLAVSLGNSYRVDFGDSQATECAAIYGTVFEDINSNANWDSTEVGIQAVTITLTDSVTTATNVYGSYTFSTTVASLYTVVETDPEGYMSTTPNEMDVDVHLGNGYQVDFGDVPFCTCPGDEYEEDDELGLAAELTVSLTQTHNFCDDATDWTYFAAEQGFVYTITTHAWGQRADTVLHLYDTDGETLLASSDDFEGTDDYSSHIIWQTPLGAAGTYYVRTTNRSGLIGCQTEYDINISQKEGYYILLPAVVRDFTPPALVEPALPSTEAEQELDLIERLAIADTEASFSPTGIITHTCPDLYEEDDTWELAKPIEDGVLQEHSFDSNPVEWAADKDFVWFDIQDGRTITFTVPVITGTWEVQLMLYDSYGDPMPEVSSPDGQLVWEADAGGRYFLAVSPPERAGIYGCADVAGYKLQADLEPRWFRYLPIIIREGTTP